MGAFSTAWIIDDAVLGTLSPEVDDDERALLTSTPLLSDAQPLLQQVCLRVERTCLSTPLQLGRDGTWAHVVRWHAYERGLEPDDYVAYALQHMDEALGLLLRLFKRGAVLGDAGGGYGEGILGWLNVQEVARLVATFLPVPAAAPIPAALWAIDPFIVSDVLPSLRTQMTRLHQAATLATAKRGGLLIRLQ